MRKLLFNLHILLVSCESSAIKYRVFNSTSNVRWMSLQWYLDDEISRNLRVSQKKEQKWGYERLWTELMFSRSLVHPSVPSWIWYLRFQLVKVSSLQTQGPLPIIWGVHKNPICAALALYTNEKSSWCNLISMTLTLDSKYAIFYMAILPCKHNLTIYDIKL